MKLLFYSVALLANVCALSGVVAQESDSSQRVQLFRASVRERTISTLCRTTVACSGDLPAPVRVWTGVRKRAGDVGVRKELRTRHDVWLQKTLRTPGLPPSELDARRVVCALSKLKFVDAFVLQLPLQDGRLRWLYIEDSDIDGSLTDESPMACLFEDPETIEASSVLTAHVRANSQCQISPSVPVPCETKTKAAVVARESLEIPAELQLGFAEITRLDAVAVRKQNLRKTIAKIDQFLLRLGEVRAASMDELAIAELQDLEAECWYRRGRAIGYLELPDVVAKNPIRDQQWVDTEFERSFQALKRLRDVAQPKYVLLAVRYHRRRQEFGTALQLVREYSRTHPHPVWRYKKTADLYQELGDELHAHEAAAELWVHSQMPPMPKCCIVNAESIGAFHRTLQDSVVKVEADFQFQQCRKNVFEAVVWCAPDTSISKVALMDAASECFSRSYLRPDRTARIEHLKVE